MPVSSRRRASGDEAVGAACAHCRRTTAELREHEHTRAVARIQRWAGQGGQALFDTILVFENYPVDQVLKQTGGAGLVFDERCTAGRTHAALSPGGGYPGGRGHAYRLRIPAQPFRCWTDRRDKHGSSSPCCWPWPAAVPLLGDIDLLDADERKQLLDVWNRRTDEYRPRALVHELFQDRARQDGEATAIVFQDTTVSYRTLNARSNRLARRLRQMGWDRTCSSAFACGDPSIWW